MRLLVCLALVFAFPVLTSAQQTAQQPAPVAVFTFTYENASLAPPFYRLTVREDGTGEYLSGDDIESASKADNERTFHRQISITAPLLHAIFSIAREQKFFAVACEAKGGSRVAFQGAKTFAYEGPDGRGSCQFNYSKENSIQQLSEKLESVASTLEAGQRLVREHQHDRLGLDAELAILARSVGNGTSSEIQNIRTVLDAIAADPGVLNRARQTAMLLAAGRSH